MSRLSFAKAFAVVATVVSMQAGATAINLISNGSFETVDPNATTKSYKFYDSKNYAGIDSSYKWGIFNPTAVTGWSSLYGNQVELDINGLADHVDTAFGKNYVELDTHFGVTGPTGDRKTTNESNVGIAQNLTGLKVGETYQLTFWYRARTTLADDNLMNVYWLPTSVAAGLNQALKASEIMPLLTSYIVKTVDYNAAQGNKDKWVQYSQKFVATDSQMTIGFGAAGEARWNSPSYQDVVSKNGNKDGAQLDNISLYAIPTPAPLALLGLGLLALAVRRRRA